MNGLAAMTITNVFMPSRCIFLNCIGSDNDDNTYSYYYYNGIGPLGLSGSIHGTRVGVYSAL